MLNKPSSWSNSAYDILLISAVTTMALISQAGSLSIIGFRIFSATIFLSTFLINYRFVRAMLPKDGMGPVLSLGFGIAVLMLIALPLSVQLGILCLMVVVSAISIVGRALTFTVQALKGK